MDDPDKAKQAWIARDDALDVVIDAIQHLPFPLAIYNRDDRLVVCSDEYRATVAGLNDVIPYDPLQSPVKYTDIAAFRNGALFSKDVAAARTQSELARHRVPGGWQKDAQIRGQWSRKMKTVTPRGNVIGATLSIDELIKKSAALADAKRQLEYQAFHDPLTDLPNRRALTSHLAQALRNATDCGKPIALLHIDLDHFKSVNDTLGHEAGDHVLQFASDVLRNSVRGNDMVARIGGDEFVVLCETFNEPEDIAIVAQRIVNLMKEPVAYREEFCQIGASVGIAVSDKTSTPDKLLAEADYALYESKRKGRGTFDFFLPVFRDRQLNHARHLNTVREAIMLNAFDPYFQPLVDARSGALIGVEALARWLDREVGPRHPRDFLPLLGEAGLMADLDSMIYTKSVQALTRWEEAEVAIPSVTVNVSPEWLQQHDIVDFAKWKVDEAGLEPDRIGLEVLESALCDTDTDRVSKNLKALRAAGFRISLDHFGTGEASIGGLRKVVFDAVKIDEGFVEGIEAEGEARTICAALIELIRKLGMTPMCTGIETDVQWKSAIDLGCEIIQGFAVAKPMPASRVANWLAQYHEERAVTLKAIA